MRIPESGFRNFQGEIVRRARHYVSDGKPGFGRQGGFCVFETYYFVGFKRGRLNQSQRKDKARYLCTTTQIILKIRKLQSTPIQTIGYFAVDR